MIKNAMLTETEKACKRNKKLQQGGCSSNQGVCRKQQGKAAGPCWIGLQGPTGLGGSWVDPVGHGLV